MAPLKLTKGNIMDDPMTKQERNEPARPGDSKPVYEKPCVEVEERFETLVLECLKGDVSCQPKVGSS